MQKPNEKLVPYVISKSPIIRPGLHYIDPLVNENYNISEALLKLDWGSFGASNMKMPRWVFYDCAMMPGVVSGYGLHSKDVDEDVRNFFKLEMDFYPLAMSIMIPMMEKGSFFAHNLCSINAMFPGKYKSIGKYSKALSLDLSGAKVLYGATKWTSEALFIHLSFGELEVVSAVSRLHGEKYTLTYRTQVRDPWKFHKPNHKHSNLKILCSDESKHDEIQEGIVSKSSRYFILNRVGDEIYLRKEEFS